MYERERERQRQTKREIERVRYRKSLVLEGGGFLRREVPMYSRTTLMNQGVQGIALGLRALQGYLAHKKQSPPEVPRGALCLTSEVPLKFKDSTPTDVCTTVLFKDTQPTASEQRVLTRE